MNETLGQLFETLSTLEPTIVGGAAVAVASIGYLAYHVKKNKELSKEESKEENPYLDKEISDVNEITMETKYFSVDDSQETTEVTTFKDLDDFSIKPNLGSLSSSVNFENIDDTTFSNNSTETNNNDSLLATHNSAIDFIEESNQEFDKISTKDENEIDDQKHPIFDQFATLPENNIANNTDVHLQNTELNIEVQKTENLESEKEASNATLDLPLVPDFSSNTVTSSSIETEVNPIDKEPSNTITPINTIPLVSSLSNPNESSKESGELLVFALEADTDNNKKDALTYLNQAIETEINLTDRVRLKIILQTYENTDKPLSKVLSEIPTIQQVQELTQKRSEPVRFVKADDLKFIDEDIPEIESKVDDNFDVSSLLAIPQNENADNTPLTGEEINNKVVDAMQSIPSLSDVTFRNIDAPNLDTKDHLENFLETLATDIEKDNLQISNQAQEDNLLTESVLAEVGIKTSEELSVLENTQETTLHEPSLESAFATNAVEPDSNISSNVANKEVETTNVVETVSNNEVKDEVKETNNKLADLSSLNFHDVSNVSEPESAQVTSKVWVNLIINNGQEQVLVNKKFQINGEFSSVEGNTSLNKQLNAWVKQTYNTTSYVVTLLLPVQ